MNILTRPTPSLSASISQSAQLCEHCGLAHYEGTKFALQANGEVYSMCCPACNSVAQMIQDIYAQANAEDIRAGLNKHKSA